MTQEFKLTEKQEVAKILVEGGHSIFLFGAGGCVDKDTEFLTPVGWVPFDLYTNQQVLVYDPETDKSRFEIPQKYIKLPTEKLNRVVAGGLDMVLCDEHKVVYWPTTSSTKPKTLLFKDVKLRHEKSRVGWSGRIKTTFGFDGKGIDYDEGQLRLQIAVMADGRIVKEGKDNYTQMRFVKERKYLRLIKLCDLFGLRYDDRGKNNQGQYEVIVWPKTGTKRFSEDFYSCTQEQLNTIVDEVRHWDSSIEGYSIRYVSKYKIDADFIQFAFSACGYRTAFYEDKREGKRSFRITASTKTKPFRSIANKDEKPAITEYQTLDGYKYCFTVSTGMFVARRKGSVFITGNCGKSVLVRNIMDKYTVLAAPTGIAAVNIGGATLHSLFGLPLSVVLQSDYMQQPTKRLKELFGGNACKRIVIDEISMVRSDMLDLIDHRLKQVKGNGKPFGGIQMILVGDFFQLSPIVNYKEKKLFFSKYKSPYCFTAKSWLELNPEIVMLTEVMRQDDAKQIALLNSIRTKDKHHVRAVKVINEISSTTRREEAVTLCSLKKDVEIINNYRYSRVKGKEYSYQAYSKGKFAKGDQPVPENLRFKEGVHVVIVANNPEEGFYNGEQGVIIALSALDVTVRKTNGEEVIIEPFEWKKNDFDVASGKLTRIEVGSYTQIPLLVGYSISTHRAQGMTLPEYNLDLGSRGAFAHGQAYVALSRAKDLTKVHMSLPLKQRDIIVEQEVLDFYQSL